MPKLVWDDVSEHFFETGVDHGVLFPMDALGEYQKGVVWNGLISVTEKPSGAEPSPMYADNIKYLNLMSAEEFGATIEAYTYPDEFGVCDGSVEAVTGLSVAQQARRAFGLCYRTKVGNEVAGDSLGYKLHIVYNCLAAPSEKAYSTINDTPEAITFSWEITTTPIAIDDYQASACLTIDSREADEDCLAALEALLFGTAGTDSELPTPAEVITVMTPSAG